MAGQEPPGSYDRFFYPAAMAVCAACLVASLWSVPYLPTNDGPQSIFSAYVENHYGDPGTPYARHFERLPALAARGFSLVFRPLETFLRWDDAVRVALCVIALAWAAAFAWFTRAVDAHRRALGFVGFVLALSWPLYMGFFSFAIATAAALAFIARCLASPQLSTRAQIAVSIGVVACIGLHGVGAALGAAVLGIVVVVSAAAGDRRRAVLWMGATAVPFAVAMAYLAGLRAPLQQTGSGRVLHFEPLLRQLKIVPGLAMPGPGWRSALVLVVVLASLALVALGWRSRPRRDLALFVAALVLLVVGCVAPTHIPGWHYFGARFFPLGVAAAVALVPIERLSDRRRRVAEVACLVVALAGLWVSARLHQRLYQGCRDSLSGLEQPLRRDVAQLPVSFSSHCGVDADPERSEIPYLNPLLHAGALYAVAHGGSIPRVFGGIPAVHALRVRMPPEVVVPPDYMMFLSVDPELERDPRRRRAVVTDVAAWGVFYDNIVAFGTRPEDRTLLVARGYRTEWQQGSLFIGAFDPCNVELVVTATAREELEVSFGAWGLRELDRMRVPAERVDPVSPTHVEFSPLCGDLWVVVRSIGSGAICRQAREDGKMRVTATRPRTQLECDLGM